jgi:hypothetical protein
MWYILVAIILCATEVFAQGGPGVGPAPGVGLNDEGVVQGRVQILNCTGAGITCSKSGVTGTLNVAGGAGSANGVVVSINLGTGGGLIYTVTVIGQAWVTATSTIACTPFGTTADGLTPETVMASGIQAVTSAYVVGTGFNLSVYSPHGATGTYRFGCTGV